jgi:hypothetical protein
MQEETMKEEVLGPTLVLLVIFGGIVAIIRTVQDNRTRNRLIDKGQIDENIKYLYPARQDARGQSLKWGMMLIGIGIAFLIGRLADSEEMGVAAGFFCAGIALVLYHWIAKKNDKDAN